MKIPARPIRGKDTGHIGIARVPVPRSALFCRASGEPSGSALYHSGIDEPSDDDLPAADGSETRDHLLAQLRKFDVPEEQQYRGVRVKHFQRTPR
jgi:hypothetical protein